MPIVLFFSFSIFRLNNIPRNSNLFPNTIILVLFHIVTRMTICVKALYKPRNLCQSCRTLQTLDNE